MRHQSERQVHEHAESDGKSDCLQEIAGISGLHAGICLQPAGQRHAAWNGIPPRMYQIRQQGTTSPVSTSSSRRDTIGEQVHIPVILTDSGIHDLVYNDFYIGEGADVEIIAGCGIHNDGCDTSQHDGIHTFHIGRNARVVYTEKHYGEGNGEGERILNPTTNIHMEEGSFAQMDMSQIRGVDSTERQDICQAGAEGQAGDQREADDAWQTACAL